MSGESVGPTMPLLAWKGYRGAGRAVWLGTNPAILRRIPINSRQCDGPVRLDLAL
jgi:hypothetical protein